MTDKLWKVFERFVGQHVFDGAERNLGSGAINKNDQGDPRPGDLIHDTYLVECKCYKKIAVFRWWDKVRDEAKVSRKIPVIVMKEVGDNKDVLVVLHYTTFVEMRRAWEKKNGR